MERECHTLFPHAYPYCIDSSYYPIAFFFFFKLPCLRYMEVPRLGVENRSCGCRPTPQPQQCQILGVSVTYTAARGNA